MSTKARSSRKRKRSKVFYGNLKGQRPSLGLPPPSPASDSQPTLSSAPALTPNSATPSSTTPTSPGTPIPGSTRSYQKIALAREAQAGPSSASQPWPSSQPGLSSASPVTYLAEPEEDYNLIKTSSLARAVSVFLCCGTPLTINVDRRSRKGFVVKMELCCTVCGKSAKIMDPYSKDDLKVNTRSVVAARMIGRGRNGLATFAGVMGLPPPLTRPHITNHNREIQRASSQESLASMLAAATHLRQLHKAKDDEILDVKVTCDWQKRGHQSLFGVVVASWDTGQVLDTEVLSKWCSECNSRRHMDPTSEEFLDWWEGHQGMCEANFYGSSGSMEVEGALKIWKRSEERYKLWYISMISDGDASTYPKIVQANPYGDDHPISKHECVGHVQKRMFKHLDTAKKKKNLGADSKEVRMGGKGRLTVALMKKLQKFYGKAIRSHINDVQGMKDAVMATFYHSSSTDANPQHHLCPSGSTSWCKHKRAEATGASPPQHNTTIHPEIAPFIEKVYEDLSSDALMERCMLGATQNQNESFNSVIWNRCPKTEFCSAVVVGIAVDLAVITFNSGQGAMKGVLQRLNFNCGSATLKFLDSVDDTRIWMARVQRERAGEEEAVPDERLDRVALDEQQDIGDYVPGGH